MDQLHADKTREISVQDIYNRTRQVKNHLKSKWKLILIYTLVGTGLGLAYSLLVKPKYTAVSTFVLEEGDQAGMLGQYASLASLAGIDLNGGGGIFKGDNILELYKSRTMLEKALLTPVNIAGKRQLLIDRYITFNHLQEYWKNHDDIQNINFNGDPAKFNRKQDSLITDITDIFNKKNLDVNKPDKKLSIIRVAFTAKDEIFAKEFTDKLVDNVNKFYIQTKTKKSALNVNILQHQADSVKNALNSSLNGVASAIDATPNANPAMLLLRVPSQKKQVDVQAGTAIYSEIIKNLEISKISLRQQTPLIQFIDQPVLPLTNNHVGKVKGIVIGAFLGLFLTVTFLFMQMLIRPIINNSL